MPLLIRDADGLGAIVAQIRNLYARRLNGADLESVENDIAAPRHEAVVAMHQDCAIDLVIALRIAEVFDIDRRRFWMLRYWLRKNCGDRWTRRSYWSLYLHGRRLDGKDASARR